MDEIEVMVRRRPRSKKGLDGGWVETAKSLINIFRSPDARGSAGLFEVSGTNHNDKRSGLINLLTDKLVYEVQVRPAADRTRSVASEDVFRQIEAMYHANEARLVAAAGLV
jgi:hypothetical protein